MDVTRRKITKIAREVSKFTVRTLKEDGIGPSEFDFIHAVRKNPGITQAGVQKILGIDKAAVARQAASLEAKGYLIKESNPNDARSRLLYATEKSERLKNSKAHIETLFYGWLSEPLSDEEREKFAALLDVLYRRCKEESKAGFPNMSRLIREENQNEEE